MSIKKECRLCNHCKVCIFYKNIMSNFSGFPFSQRTILKGTYSEGIQQKSFPYVELEVYTILANMCTEFEPGAKMKLMMEQEAADTF